MDAATPSKRARTTSAAATASRASTTQKIRKAALFAVQAATPEKPMAADLTWTPEKTEQRPLLRRAAGKGAVALSVKEVRRAALGLRRADKGRAEIVSAANVEEDALESVARELGVSAAAGRSPVKRRPEVKLPESYEMLCEFFNCFSPA